MSGHAFKKRAADGRRQGARFVVAEHRRRRRVRYYEHGPAVRVLRHIWAALAQPSTWLIAALVLYLLSK
ncbi:hypothetical protein [Caballeronia novacaledonica]|uniref:Uncharacterized protein n=1 Tax=Caballeronia novacaledonica TaxID=1544861 RepID=A0AA37IED3_9BURK|nr:hypothetical protein [Caballeronia novacaledonica]GJH28142.1 hypothetical protein CBA19CS42_26520 [Caballeronia novacaledonica]